jgi:uncharacterized RDD family membrane protein YckC
MVIIEGKKKNLAQRYYANLLDYFILLLCIVTYIYLAGKPDEYNSYHVTGFKALLIPTIWFIYFPLCERVFGQTPGKKAFHLRVVDANGKHLSILQTSLRRFCDLAEFPLLGVVGIVMINYSPKNQRLGDMLAGTTVLRTDTICTNCHAELELTPKEALRGTFVCPICHEGPTVPPTL